MKVSTRTVNVGDIVTILATVLLIVVLGWAAIWAFSGRAHDRGYNEGQEYVYGLWATWVMKQPGIQRIIFETDSNLLLDSTWWATWHQVNRDAGRHPIETLLLRSMEELVADTANDDYDRGYYR